MIARALPGIQVQAQAWEAPSEPEPPCRPSAYNPPLSAAPPLAPSLGSPRIPDIRLYLHLEPGAAFKNRSRTLSSGKTVHGGRLASYLPFPESPLGGALPICTSHLLSASPQGQPPNAMCVRAGLQGFQRVFHACAKHTSAHPTNGNTVRNIYYKKKGNALGGLWEDFYGRELSPAEVTHNATLRMLTSRPIKSAVLWRESGGSCLSTWGKLRKHKHPQVTQNAETDTRHQSGILNKGLGAALTRAAGAGDALRGDRGDPLCGDTGVRGHVSLWTLVFLLGASAEKAA